MNIFAIIGNLLGIGKSYLDNRSKLKQLKAEQEFAIVEAETGAIVDRIKSNTDSDNEIDLITARNKKYTLKDEVVTYLFLVPVFVATIVPFMVAYQTEEWISLNKLIRESYQSLDQLPQWYKYVVFAIIVDVLGFRSFARKIVEMYHTKKELSSKLKN